MNLRALNPFRRKLRDPETPPRRLRPFPYRSSAGPLIANQWSIGAKISAGSFGQVFEAHCIYSGVISAVKIAKGSSIRQLENEYNAYTTMRISRSSHGIPSAFAYEVRDDKAYMVMECLGNTLESMRANSGTFPLDVVYFLGFQMITRIQFVHSHGIIHRDIKPDNLLMGVNADVTTLYLVDFGLSKFFRYPESGEHIPMREGKQLVGTCRFCSINTHNGLEQSRRDDLESIGYCMVYLFKGYLPWQGGAWMNENARSQRIGWLKEATSMQNLCRGMGLSMVHYFNYVKALPFDARPDYEFVRRMFLAEIHDIRQARREEALGLRL